MYAVPVGEQQMPAMELFLLRKGMCSSLQRDADKVILVGTLRWGAQWLLFFEILQWLQHHRCQSLWHDQRIWTMEPRKMRRADGWPPWHGGAAGQSVQPAPRACASSNISPKSHTFGSFPIEPSNIIAVKIARKQPFFFALKNPDSWLQGWASVLSAHLGVEPDGPDLRWRRLERGEAPRVDVEDVGEAVDRHFCSASARGVGGEGDDPRACGPSRGRPYNGEGRGSTRWTGSRGGEGKDREKVMRARRVGKQLGWRHWSGSSAGGLEEDCVGHGEQRFRTGTRGGYKHHAV